MSTIGQAGIPAAGRARSRGLLIGLVGLVISVIAVILVVRSVDVGKAADAIAGANLAFVAAGFATWALGLAIRAVRWSRLLPPIDGHAVPARHLLPVLLVGYLGNAVLPARLGEPIRAYLISRRDGVTFGGALGSVVLERIVDTAVLAVLAFAAALLTPNAPAWILSGTAIIAAVGAFVVVMLATIGFGPLLPIATWLLRRLPSRFREASRGTMQRFVYWSGGAHRRGVVIFAALMSLAAWVTDAATMWFMARAVGADLSPSGALLVSTITVLSTAIPAAPGYVGTYELAALSVASAIGLPSSLALGMAVLAHAFAVLPSAVAGAIAVPFVGRGGLRTISAAATAEQTEATRR